ncbi:MAG: type II secretion system protein GspJ [Nevskiaceae bacterium]|nr:MAG: type II secretion system protein GspJ [Nevskiaceae bacterium]
MMRARGFTLLELIVVIAIFGIMAAMAYGGLNSVLQTRARVEQSLSRTAQYQKAWMRLRNDFQEVRNRPVRDAYGDLQPAFSGNRDGRVDFTHAGWRNPLLQPRAGLERVFYHYNDKDKTLVRSSYRVLDQAQDSKPVDNPILDRVTDISWRYLDTSREWQTTWPPSTTATSTPSAATVAAQAPPLAVELTLHTEDLGALRFLFRLGLDPLPKDLKTGYVDLATQATGATTTTTNTNTTTTNGNTEAK